MSKQIPRLTAVEIAERSKQLTIVGTEARVDPAKLKPRKIQDRLGDLPLFASSGEG